MENMAFRIAILLAILFIGAVAYLENGFSSRWLSFSTALLIPLSAILFYVRIKPVRISLYLYQLTIFSVFYPLTWFAGYLFASSIFSMEVYENSLWAFCLFIFSFIFSYLLVSQLIGMRVKLGYLVSHAVPNVKALYAMFFSLIIIVLALRWYNGILFHIAINPDYNFNAGAVENLVKILTSLCVVPSILLVIFGEDKASFNKHAYIMLFIFILVHMPTGLRSATIIPLVAFVIIGAFFNALKAKSIFVLIVLMIFSVVLQGNLRVDVEDRSAGVEDNTVLFLHRMSDLRNTGLMIELIDNNYQTRWFDNLDNYLLCYPPNIFRSLIGIPCNTSESTQFTEEIGVAPSHSSEPITLIGDSFSRFRTLGLIVVGGIFGLLVCFVDWLISKLRVEVAIVYFVVFSQLVFSTYSASLLQMLLVFTRDSVLLFFVFTLLADYYKFGLHRPNENYH